MPEFPYPTHIEVIRGLAKVLGVKAGNKQLDDKAKDKVADYRLVNEFANEIFVYISKQFGPQLSKALQQHFTLYLNEYISLLSTTYADGLSRQNMNAILSKTIWSKYVVKSIESAYGLLSGIKPSITTLFSAHTSCTSQTISWLEDREAGWTRFYNKLDKENKAKVKAWKEAEHIPDVQSLVSLQSWSSGQWPEQVDWQKVRVLLFIATVIDRIAKEEGASLLFEECRVLSWGANSTKTFGELVSEHQQEYKNRISTLLPLIGEIQEGLKRTTVKIEGQFKYYKSALAELDRQLSVEDHKSHFSYWLDWHKGRMYVLNGQLEEAHQLYKLAFDGGLFRAGINQKMIIEEAIVVAASLGKPDKVFLKHLKNAQLMFKYDIPSVQSNESSNKFSDIIEDWEVQNWKASFFRVFPKQSMFMDVEMPDIQANIGVNAVSDIDKIKPDYRNPNRKQKIGEDWKKIYPQLVWFTEIEKKDVVKRLLTEGANVNMTSSSGDTAILMALEALNVKAIPYRSLDEELFNLLSQYPHSKDTMNLATSKRRLLPLISAVESGRPHIVEKVIEMGADVNVRGATDSQTALNISLKLIGILKQPQKFLTEQINMEHTPEVLDSIRRNSAGLTGFTLEEQAKHLNAQDTSTMFQRFMEIAMELIMERVEEKLNLSELRQISATLIDGNSDVNAEHKSPVEGYTPLMLAAELDEVDLFNKMLSKNGDPRKSYYCKRAAMDVDCWGIAEYFQSSKVLSTLKDIERFFPKLSNADRYH
jgi:ankyrin repeat protein